MGEEVVHLLWSDVEAHRLQGHLRVAHVELERAEPKLHPFWKPGTPHVPPIPPWAAPRNLQIVLPR